MSEDNMRCLSINDPEIKEEDYERLDLKVPAPPYGSKLYSTELC